MKYPVVLLLSVSSQLLNFGCAARPEGARSESKRVIRIDNLHHSPIRVYVASENFSPARAFLGTVEARQAETFALPSTILAQYGVVVCCEIGRTGGKFETQLVSIPQSSWLTVTVRDPIEYSDYSIAGFD